ncbi:unnamed protein product, partial [Ectocarpus sp. 4 AP-2014]
MSESASDGRDYDVLYQFEQYAVHLNALDTAGSCEDVFYEIMSGALIWKDETSQDTPVEVVWALRTLWAYRTSLMLDAPRTELTKYWDSALSLFPEWVGFSPERRKATPRLLHIHRQGSVSLKKCL